MSPGGRTKILGEPKFVAELARQKTEQEKREKKEVDIKEEKSNIHATALEETLAKLRGGIIKFKEMVIVMSHTK